MFTHWSSRGQEPEERLFFHQRKLHQPVYHLHLAINQKLLHALCKVLKCSHKPCCSCTDCQCYFLYIYFYIHTYIYSSHQPVASVLFSCVSESFCFSGNKKWFCLRQEATCIMHSLTEAPSGINISTYSKKYTVHTCYVHCTPKITIEVKTLKSSPRHFYRKLHSFCYAVNSSTVWISLRFTCRENFSDCFRNALWYN